MGQWVSWFYSSPQPDRQCSSHKDGPPRLPATLPGKYFHEIGNDSLDVASEVRGGTSTQYRETGAAEVAFFCSRSADPGWEVR